MSKIVIVGCGVVGAAIAYELSLVSSLENLDITVLEAQSQVGQVSTKAALGVLMGACGGSKTKNEALSTLRLASLLRFESLVTELEAKTGIKIPYNCHGILLLFQDLEDADQLETAAKWQELISDRGSQGFYMKWLEPDLLRSQYPHLQATAAVHSFADRSIHPSYLMQALVKGAELNGVKFICDRPVHNLSELDQLEADWIIVTAGLGSRALMQPELKKDILTSVGGQAIKVYLPDLNLKNVIYGDDTNIIPIGQDQYWIGATVEFKRLTLPRNENIDLLMQTAIKFCPAFAQAQILSTWAGDRPRPRTQGAPILGYVPNRPNTLIATGHYRNGILMAPVTAQVIKDLILEGKCDLPWQKQQLKS